MRKHFVLSALLARLTLVAALVLPACASAQDFAGASPPAAVDDDAFASLERALPSASRAFTAAVSNTRWWDLDELETRSAVIATGWRGARAAMGLSQTGMPDLGWTTLGLSVGGAASDGGAAIRLCGRVERDAPWSAARAVSTAAGLELGAGAWLVPAGGVRVWASAPQVWMRGPSPPLIRPLELGVRAGAGSGVWLRLQAPRAGDDGERALGVALELAPFHTWAEVRDAPLRGSAGVRARVAALQADVRVDVHPVLGESVRVALGWQRTPHGSRSEP